MPATPRAMSALRLSPMLHVTYPSALHLCDRIRETIKSESGGPSLFDRKAGEPKPVHDPARKADGDAGGR
jgi:hypothetical protein